MLPTSADSLGVLHGDTLRSCALSILTRLGWEATAIILDDTLRGASLLKGCSTSGCATGCAGCASTFKILGCDGGILGEITG
mmetsp:Transcript_93922/g.223470  ORF Transcript_93922/g.223470 Transcript_93922/m.223470 type:complete len:82 (+) Transcript_93922:471-716(+)